MGLIVEYLCLKDLVFPGREGGGGGGWGWRPGRGEEEEKLEGRRYYIIFRNKTTDIFLAKLPDLVLKDACARHH